MIAFKNIIGRLGIGATLLFIAGLAAGAGAQSTNNDLTSMENAIQPDQDTVEEYWTDERLRSASPLPAPEISESELQELLKTQIPSEQPGPTESPALPSLDFGTLGVPSEADVTVHPYKHAGILYFTLNGANRLCTAQFVGGLNVLLTAAHCVRDASSGQWATNVLFRRAYKSGAYQQQVTTYCLSTYSGWVNGGAGRWRWDYSFARTNQASTSGHFGLRVGLPYTTWDAIGYPSNYGSNSILQKVNGNKGVVSGGVVQMVGNPMRSGNSGGAWQVTGTAIGDNSFHISGNTTDEWGPLFDNYTTPLWAYANNSCR
jgi:hypothetical protein